MTHHEDGFIAAPAHLQLIPAAGSAAASDTEVRLLIRGQGTIGFACGATKGFSVTTGTAAAGSMAFRWDVGVDKVSIRAITTSGEVRLHDAEWRGVGIDDDKDCPYWFSIDCHNGRLSYGKGEMRAGCRLQNVNVKGLLPAGDNPLEDYRALAAVDHVVVKPALVSAVDVWRDPVTVEPAMRIVPRDQITMSAIAEGTATVAENLTPECQTLYANIAGEAFTLDTPDFPDFSKAIQASINNPEGWCYNVLRAKAEEFGEPAPLKTYLRITMGVNQGESPGIPFVMEIWPFQHYSPIHDHGAADAIIKVLRGTIHVSLYPMLSAHHTEPFAETSFTVGEVTWITPRLNQVHMLRNDHYEACVTIQCYMYAQSDTTHHPYFDYMGKDHKEEFEPNSDADFLDFKEIMRKEWILGS